VTTPHALSDVCPCCHDEGIAPGDDTDRALVTAFLCGGVAGRANVPPEVALCKKHAALAREAVASLFVFRVDPGDKQ
jgi:hypothetical protein